jgi:anti-anti-sigma regulatory factor
MSQNSRDASVVLNPSGALIIDRASAFKSEMAAALAKSRKITVDLSLVEELDLACLQILYAARRATAASGGELHLTGTVSSRIARRLSAVGILRGTPGRAEDFEASLLEF